MCVLCRAGMISKATIARLEASSDTELEAWKTELKTELAAHMDTTARLLSIIEAIGEAIPARSAERPSPA